MTNATASAGNAVYFDGTSNRKRRVSLQLADVLDIVEDGKVIGTWPYSGIRRADGTRGLRLSCVSALPLARLEIEDAATAQAVTARCTALDVGRGGTQTLRIVGRSLAAACSIALMAAFGIPYAADRLAPMVPVALEKRIGEAVDRQLPFLLDGKTCSNPDGQAAFMKMMDALAKAGGLETPRAEVISSKLPNAFALPGGKVYLTDGLLQKARNVDEVAGVLGHELGHVQHRDSMRVVIQNGGTSFLIGLLFGDVMGGSAVIFATRSMLNASYSRDAERSADEFSVELMHKLGRSPKAMGELLVRVSGEEGKKGGLTSVMSSHPLSAERLDAMKKQDRASTGAEILNAREWAALKAICSKK